MPQQSQVTIHRNERVLAFMLVAIIVFSVGCFIAIIIAGGMGVTNFSVGVWPTVFAVPYLGLPLGIVIIMVLLIVNIRRRSREAREEEARQAAVAKARPKPPAVRKASSKK